MKEVPKTVTELNASEIRLMRRLLNQALPGPDDFKAGKVFDNIGRAMALAAGTDSKPIKRASKRTWTFVDGNRNLVIIAVRERMDGSLVVKGLTADNKIIESVW